MTAEKATDPADLPGSVNAATLAKLLGVSYRRVEDLARDGWLTRKKVGKVYRYGLPDSVIRYVEYVRKHPRGRNRTDAGDERERLAKEQADKVALQNAKARGELLDAAEVARQWQEYTTALRAALLAVPARVAAQTGLDRTAAASLDAEVRAALSQIADDGQAE